MATISEDYVSFEVANLLKEKGFDGKCSKVWIYSKSINLENNAQLVSSPHFMEGESLIDNSDIDKVLTSKEVYEDAYLCPTLQMAMKWLREVHNINFNIDWNPSFKDYFVEIFKPTILYSTTTYQSYEQACEAAIKYCLENLI